MRAAGIAPQVLEQIAQAIRSLRYGTVHITVHDARVVQIDKVERVRIDPAAELATARDAPVTQPHDRTSGVTRPHGR